MKQAWTIDEFCQSHCISRATFYNLLKRGEAPKTFLVGARRLVSVEAAAAWRSHLESIAADSPAVPQGRA